MLPTTVVFPNLRGSRPVSMNLATWLGGGSVLIVLVALGAMGIACSLLISRLVDELALARAEYAAASAREALRAVVEDRMADAHVLADLPTVRRLLGANDLPTLQEFLQRYCDSSIAEICALLGTDAPLMTAGPTAPWKEITRALAHQGERFSLAPRDGGPVLFGAAVPFASVPGLRAVAISRGNDTLLRGISRELGADVTLVIRGTPSAPAPRHEAASKRNAAVAELVPALDAYVGTVAVFSHVDEQIGVLEAHLSTKSFSAQTRQFRSLLALVTALVAIGAGIGGWLFGRRLAKPVSSLGSAAAQIGRGDFDAAIPVAGPREVAALGQTMEDMRRNLLELIDTLQRREQETRVARRARDAVLGNISHEFRTPLAAQLASIELLRDGLDSMPPESQRELLTNVERGVRRLMRLIDNLLESVRIESGQLSIRHQSVDLREVVREAAEWMVPLLDQRGIGLLVELGEDVPAVVGDAQRLVQVLVNLLSNAAKFAPEKSVIRIGAERRDRAIALWVEDEGPGVPDGDPARLFERFRRGTGTEPHAPGLGLGLSIVKSIVARHEGTITTERTAAHRTRFTVTLPLEEDA